jgi:hypothetical protein
VRLITLLVGQPQLMEQKAQYQLSGDEQIVARFMIEQMHFRGITGAVGRRFRTHLHWHARSGH